MTDAQNAQPTSPSRRSFLKQGAVAVAGGAAVNLSLQSAVHAAGDDVLKVGLIGCGGRGSQAAVQALTADKNTRLVAMADAFGDRLESSYGSIKASSVGDRVTVDEGAKFVGFDAYKDVIAASDVVLLTTPPHFRPEHLKAAVEAGKHCFVEKPVAVDAKGVRSVLATSKLAEKKGLSIVSGLCWRYHNGMRATFDRIHDGTIGDVTGMQCSYMSQGVWEPRKTREQCSSDMEYQMRNWYYYTWLSGDFNTEQHVHSLDKMAWAMQDEYPVEISGSGGRIQRTDPKYGDIYDHFNIVYEWANGVKAFARCRHFRGCSSDVTDHIFGASGRMDVMKHRAYDWNNETMWRFKGDGGNMYQIEHNEMFAGIRRGEPINNGYYMAMSTQMAVAGRMVAYTGKTLSWDDALNSQLDLSPKEYEWADAPKITVATPGVTKFV